jgi:hypothetical protein
VPSRFLGIRMIVTGVLRSRVRVSVAVMGPAAGKRINQLLRAHARPDRDPCAPLRAAAPRWCPPAWSLTHAGSAWPPRAYVRTPLVADVLAEYAEVLGFGRHATLFVLNPRPPVPGIPYGYRCAAACAPARSRR